MAATFVNAPLVTDLAALDADIAIIGAPHGIVREPVHRAVAALGKELLEAARRVWNRIRCGHANAVEAERRGFARKLRFQRDRIGQKSRST